MMCRLINARLTCLVRGLGTLIALKDNMNAEVPMASLRLSSTINIFDAFLSVRLGTAYSQVVPEREIRSDACGHCLPLVVFRGRIRLKFKPLDDVNIQNILKLRLVVGYLGERSHYGWWSTTFLDSSSKTFLEPIFPKTMLLAQYHGISEAARRLHDEHIGIGHVFHLFRLPEELEQDLHNTIQQKTTAEALSAHLQNKEAALQALAEIAGASISASEGPIAVGKLSELPKPSTLKRIAQTYLAAFENGVRSYPYVAG